MGTGSKILWATVIGVIAVVVGVYSTTRQEIPAHLLGHKLVYSRNFIPEKVGSDLLNLMKEMKSFPTNAADLQFYKTKHEHIGEAIPIGPGGRCDHPFLIPSSDKTQCVLPGRIDIGRHYILTGGPDGIKETYDKLVSRVQSFGRYMFELDKYPLVQRLFDSESFTRVARAVCPDDRQYLDPFQFNIITQIPGQTVAMHTDAPYFWGATRFQFPQWLLASMVFSNLFPERFVDQVQVVGYLHRWQPDPLSAPAPTFNASDVSSYLPFAQHLFNQARAGPSPGKRGEFVYWDDENPVPKREQPEPLAGSAVDGSKVVHAAVVYRPSAETPFLDKSKVTSLEFAGNDQWDLISGGEKLASYTTDDLRISIVYRARCFKNKAEALRFISYQYASTPEEVPAAVAKLKEAKAAAAGVTEKTKDVQDECDKSNSGCRSWTPMTLDSVLATFINDLVSRGRITRERGDYLFNGTASGGKDLAEARLSLALLIMDEYIKYPLASPSEAIIPFNYCALGRLVPQLNGVLSYIC